MCKWKRRPLLEPQRSLSGDPAGPEYREPGGYDPFQGRSIALLLTAPLFLVPVKSLDSPAFFCSLGKICWKMIAHIKCFSTFGSLKMNNRLNLFYFTENLMNVMTIM